MKAIVQKRYGGPDAMELRDIDTPVPGRGEVLVLVKAAGAHVGDWHRTTGLPYLMRLMGFGLRASKSPPGSDMAGTVVAVGPDVTGFEPGEEVFGVAFGAFAEYACAPQGKLALKPANLAFQEAAALPASALAALQGLRDVGRLRSGQRVLIIGAAGGVGSFAVPLAKAFGAEVTGVCSTDKLDLVRSLGADDVIDYTRTDVTDGSRRYDLILDTAGNRPLSRLRRALTPTGTLVIVGGEGKGRWLGGVDRVLRALLMSPFVRQKLRGLFSVERGSDLQTLRELTEAGKVRPVIGRTYPLAGVPDAIRYLHDGHARGKVVITVP